MQPLINAFNEGEVSRFSLATQAKKPLPGKEDKIRNLLTNEQFSLYEKIVKEKIDAAAKMLW